MHPIFKVLNLFRWRASIHRQGMFVLHVTMASLIWKHEADDVYLSDCTVYNCCNCYHLFPGSTDICFPLRYEPKGKYIFNYADSALGLRTQ